jgi:hypothetical protein
MRWARSLDAVSFNRYLLSADTSHPRRPLHQADQVAFGIEEAGDDAAVGNGVRAEGCSAAVALDGNQGGLNVRNRDVEHGVRAIVPHGTDAPADAGAGIDERVVFLDRRDLSVEDALVEGLQQGLVFAENLEVNYRIGHSCVPPDCCALVWVVYPQNSPFFALPFPANRPRGC